MRRGTSNEIDTIILLQEIDNARTEAVRAEHGGVGILYNSRVTCTGFMGTNPNHQIAYAVENGLIIDESE